MAEPIFSLTFNDRAIRQRLDALQRKSSDLTPLMRSIGEALVLSTDRRFETETDVRGVPFTPLSSRTLAQKRSQGRILKILQSTGRLRSSITYRATPDRVVVGTNVQYAVKPQLGIEQPQRQYLGVSEADRVAIDREVSGYLNPG